MTPAKTCEPHHKENHHGGRAGRRPLLVHPRIEHPHQVPPFKNARRRNGRARQQHGAIAPVRSNRTAADAKTPSTSVSPRARLQHRLQSFVGQDRQWDGFPESSFRFRNRFLFAEPFPSRSGALLCIHRQADHDKPVPQTQPKITPGNRHPRLMQFAVGPGPRKPADDHRRGQNERDLQQLLSLHQALQSAGWLGCASCAPEWGR